MRSQIVKNLLLWMLIIIMVVYGYSIFKKQGADVQELSFSDFMEKVEDGQVDEATFSGDFIQGQITGTLNNGQEYKTYGLIDGDVYAQLNDKKVKVTYKEKGESPLVQILFNLLPILLLVGLMLFFMRQMQATGGKAMSFGKSRAKLLNENQNPVTFANVAGVDEAKEELEEIIAFLKDPKKFARLGGHIPKGVLLIGAPGMGKTLLARAIAGEAEVPFFNISGSEFVEMFVGVGASRVRDLFVQGKKNAPCIIFIDEIDAVGRMRGAGLGGGHDEREQTLNQLLVEMDGFEGNEGVILIAATNRPDVLDPALLRPGRFDRRVVVPRPDVRGREGILKVHTEKTILGPNVELSVIARGTPGFSGADLANLVNEAALLAARKDREFVAMDDFEFAKDKVLMGAERRSMIISDEEKKNTAYHEAGHALVAKLIPGTDPVHKVTIIPRGMALGLTQQLPEEDKYNLSRTHATNDIAIFMGGRVAEEIALEEQTAGASNDLERATEMARKMVCEWGMSDDLGPMSYGKKEDQIFLGREIAQHQDYSEATAVDIDKEVKRIVTDGYERAKKLITENRDALEAIAQNLLERETLNMSELDLLIEGKELPPIKKPPPPAPEIDILKTDKKEGSETKPEGGRIIPEPSLA